MDIDRTIIPSTIGTSSAVWAQAGRLLVLREPLVAYRFHATSNAYQVLPAYSKRHAGPSIRTIGVSKIVRNRP
jgi:hypothetical protein